MGASPPHDLAYWGWTACWGVLLVLMLYWSWRMAARDRKGRQAVLAKLDEQAVPGLYNVAVQGYAYAQAELGSMYAAGRGVAQDYAEAASWYQKAADQGNATAQGKLAGLYARGLGVPQDYVLAHMWYNLAASRAECVSAHHEMAERRDLIAAKMTPAEIAEAQRMAREWKPK